MITVSKGSLILGIIAMSTSLKMAEFKTELGSLTAIGDEKALYLLEFVDCPGLDWEIKRLKEKTGLELISGVTEPIDSIQKELSQYFAARLQKFTTPLCIFGSPFQKRVWEELRKIPYGKTTSYGSIATTMGRPKAYRAVAPATGSLIQTGNWGVIVAEWTGKNGSLTMKRNYTNEGKISSYLSASKLLKHEFIFLD